MARWSKSPLPARSTRIPLPRTPLSSSARQIYCAVRFWMAGPSVEHCSGPRTAQVVPPFSRCAQRPSVSPPMLWLLREPRASAPHFSSSSLAARVNCSKWIAAEASSCACAFPHVDHSPVNTNLFSRPRRPSASRSNRPYRCHVLARLQNARLSPTAPLGRLVPPASLRADVRAQLLGRPRRSPGPPVEPAQLCDSLFQARLPRSPPAHHAHRRFGDAVLPVARLPAGLLPVVSCPCSQGAALPARHRAVVGELPSPRLCLENDSRQRRRPQWLHAIPAFHACARRVPSLQPFRRRSHAHAHLHTFCFSAGLRSTRTHPSPACLSLARPRRRIRSNFSARPPSSFSAHHLTIEWYRLLFAYSPIVHAVGTSLIVAAGSVALSLPLGLLAALALDRATFLGKALFRRLVLLPLILPGIITGLSLLMFAVFAGAQLSLLTVFLGHGTALISVATTELFAGLQKMDHAQEEASLDLGATPWQTFWRVTLPNLKLSLIA